MSKRVQTSEGVGVHVQDEDSFGAFERRIEEKKAQAEQEKKEKEQENVKMHLMFDMTTDNSDDDGGADDGERQKRDDDEYQNRLESLYQDDEEMQTDEPSLSPQRVRVQPVSASKWTAPAVAEHIWKVFHDEDVEDEEMDY